MLEGGFKGTEPLPSNPLPRSWFQDLEIWIEPIEKKSNQNDFARERNKNRKEDFSLLFVYTFVKIRAFLLSEYLSFCLNDLLAKLSS